MSSSLQLVNLTIEEAGRTLLHRVSMDFAAGTTYAIVGDNGSGKTTLLRTMCGLRPCAPGEVFLGHQDITSLTHRQRARTIAMFMQSDPHHAYCTGLSRIAHGYVPERGFDFWPSDPEIVQIRSLAAMLKIDHLLSRKLSQMSGGERRMVNVAKCLINPQTSVILLDEPSVFLDFSQRQNLAHVLGLARARGQTIVVASHDRDFVARCADVVMVLKDGVNRTISPSEFISEFTL